MYGPNTPPMPSVPAGLTFGPEAHVAGSLEYVSPEAVEGAASVSSQVTHTLPPQDQQLSRELAQRQSTSSYLFDAVRRLVALLLVGLLIAWLAPRWITGPAEKLLSQPAAQPGDGSGRPGRRSDQLARGARRGHPDRGGLRAAEPGRPDGPDPAGRSSRPGPGVSSPSCSSLSYLCQAIVAYLGGRWILSRIRPEWNGRIYAPLLIGLLILGLLFALPVAGGLLQFLVVLAGLGAIVLALLQRPPGAPGAG